MKSPVHIKKQGFTLLLVLVAIAIIMALVISILAMITPSRSSNNAYVRSYRYDLALESAVQEALGLLVQTTNRDHFLTHMVTDEDGSAQYYVISWFDPAEEAWMHQPLVAGVSAEKLGFTGMFDGYSEYSGEVKAGINPVEMSELGWSASGEKKINFIAPRIELENGLSYSYWIEDLNGRLDYEAVTYEGDDSNDSYDSHLSPEEQAQRAEAKITDQRHLGLNVFRTGEKNEFPVDYEKPFAKRLNNPTGGGTPPKHPFARVFEQELPPYLMSEAALMFEVDPEYVSLRTALSFGLADTIESEVVPYGHNYENAGEQKMNLNAELGRGKQAVERVANQIKNVRGFKDNATEYAVVGIHVTPEFPSASRYGGFPVETESYCKTLAANILDYADSGSAPLVERDSEKGNYRGIDAYPYYTEASRRYYLSDATEEGVVLQIRNFMELFNPTNQTIHGYVKVNIYPDESHAVKISGAEYPLPPEVLFYWRGIITIEPNSYKVIELTQDLDGDFIGDEEAYLHYELADSTGSANASRSLSKGNRMEIWWCAVNDSATPPPETTEQFSLIGGVVHGAFNIADTGLRGEEKKGIMAMEKDANNTLQGVPLYKGMTGDPRSLFYCQKQEINGLTYATQSSFGGPNNYHDDDYAPVNYETLFPDGYYNSENYGLDVRGCDASPSRGIRYPGEFGYVHIDNSEGILSQNLEEASGVQKSQYYVTQSEDDAERYFQPISNKGYFTSLGELGNIFDPAQWRNVRRPTFQEAGETVIAANYLNDDYARNPDAEMMTVEELGEYGGGMTLAIGSPEFHCFTSPDGVARQGYESAHLLDQFRITESPIRSLKSRINLNTAPRSVLQVLFSGFLHKDDQIIGEFVCQPRNASGDIASGIADGIIAARKKRPFLSLSDIALAKASLTDNGIAIPVFGEKARFESNGEKAHGFSIHQELWSDQGREELFRKMNDLFTTQSRSYRIHIQVENAKAGTESVVRKSIDVTLHPYLNDDLAVDTSRHPQVKFHHKTLK